MIDGIDDITDNDILIIELEYYELNNKLKNMLEAFDNMHVDGSSHTSSQFYIAEEQIQIHKLKVAKAKVLYFSACGYM